MSKDTETILNMACLIIGCTFIGAELGTNVGVGLYLILLTFA